MQLCIGISTQVLSRCTCCSAGSTAFSTSWPTELHTPCTPCSFARGEPRSMAAHTGSAFVREYRPSCSRHGSCVPSTNHACSSAHIICRAANHEHPPLVRSGALMSCQQCHGRAAGMHISRMRHCCPFTGQDSSTSSSARSQLNAR